MHRTGSLVVLARLSGCRSGTVSPSRPVVAVSVLPQAFFGGRIAGGRVSVAVMIPPGANPSTYEPGMVALRSVSGAVLYVALGHPHFAFEAAWVEKLLSENPRLEVIRGTGVESEENYDPHIWLSPRLVRLQVERIASALQRILPADGDAIQRNLATFLAEIDALDSEIRARLEPYRGRRVFVFHAAWGHFARDYGLVQISLEEGMKKPGAGVLASFIEEARPDKALVIFAQPQFSQEGAGLVAQEVGARVESLDPLARDWLNNMRLVAAAFEEALSS